MWGKRYMTAMPTSLPQAAPVSNEGMKTPLETLSPYVHTANKKYSEANKPSVTAVYEAENK